MRAGVGLTRKLDDWSVLAAQFLLVGDLSFIYAGYLFQG